MIAQFRSRLNRKLSERSLAVAQVEGEVKALSDALGREQAILDAQKLIQEVAEKVQEAAIKRISSVVSRCLEAVFGEDAYKFVIRFKQQRGKTEASLNFVRDGLEIEDPQEATGGGVIDVAAFSLRLAALMLSMPVKRRLLVLDEAFRFVSVGYRPAIRELLETLAEEMGIQFLIVTHSAELVCGKVIEIGD